MGELPRESVAVMEVLAALDPPSFAFYMAESTGLKIVKLRTPDPLRKGAMAEDVATIAATLGNEELTESLDDYQLALKGLAEDYNFVLIQ